MSRVIYSEAEKDAILKLVEKNKSIIENKETNKLNLEKREKTWVKITNEFNALPDVHKLTVKQVRKCWDNLKFRAKHEFSLEKKRIFKTGGGEDDEDEVQLSDRSEIVKSIIGPQLVPLPNEFDDDSSVRSPTAPKQTSNEDMPKEPDSDTESVVSVAIISTSKSMVKSAKSGKNKKRSLEGKEKAEMKDLLDFEYEEHLLRIKKLKTEIDQASEIHKKRVEVLEMEKFYWKQKHATLDSTVNFNDLYNS